MSAAHDQAGQALKNVRCPQCRRPFALIWDDVQRHPNNPREEWQTLVIRHCPSGGIYAVRIECPFCSYEEEL